MSKGETEVASESKGSKRRSPKLTKQGVPRKPHVMTPKRQEAFEKCRAARAEKMKLKKESFVQDSSKPVDHADTSQAVE